MTAKIIDGKKIAGDLLLRLKEEIAQRQIDGFRAPCLAVLLIGDNPVGVYDGTNEAQMKDLINDVKVLMAEYKRPTKEKENEK